MKIAAFHFVWVAFLSFPGMAAAAVNSSAGTSASACHYPSAKDMATSRASRQRGGASQSGSPWMPLDAVLLPTPKQRRDFMLRTIREQLESRHSTFKLDELDRVLAVMRGIDREAFVPPTQSRYAYLRMSLEIGFCQTLSDAYIIALTVAAAHIGPDDNVLDIGTGSGYQAAILSSLAGHVQSLEIIPQLADRARKRLRHLGYHNIEVATADGFEGWARLAPFDAIIVSAGGTSIPAPLIQQLRPGGRLLMPIGDTLLEEELVLVTKSKTGAVTQCTLGLAAFVPMTGQAQLTTQKPAKDGSARHSSARPFCYGVPVT